MITKRNTFPVVLLLGAVLAAPPVAARPPHPGEGVVSPPGKHYNTRESQSSQDLDSAVARIRKQTGGRVLAAETRFIDGRPVHVIRVLTPGGKVRIYRIDAGTGKQLP